MEKTFKPSKLYEYHRIKVLAFNHIVDAEKTGIEGTKIAFIKCERKSCYYHEGTCKNPAPIINSEKGCFSYDKNK